MRERLQLAVALAVRAVTNGARRPGLQLGALHSSGWGTDTAAIPTYTHGMAGSTGCHNVSAEGNATSKGNTAWARARRPADEQS